MHSEKTEKAHLAGPLKLTVPPVAAAAAAAAAAIASDSNRDCYWIPLVSLYKLDLSVHLRMFVCCYL